MRIHLIENYIQNMFEVNSYLVELETCCILIDPSCEMEVVKKMSAKPLKAVFITHGHFDHIYKLKEYLNLPIYASSKFLEVASNTKLNASLYFGMPMQINSLKFHEVFEKDEVEIDGYKIVVFETPGHSKDSLCFKIENNLFSGDTLFATSIGRTDFCGSNAKDMINSLNKIKKIGYNKLFPGHDDISNCKNIKIIDYWIDYLEKTTI